MQRDIYHTLCEWKDDKDKRPLVIRGARQVGKTFVISQFGNSEFSSFVTLNFERNPEYKAIFSFLVPREILERITLYAGKEIMPGNTLLYLDEVQECPQAIMAMRYFYEEMPTLHLIAAGSLLEFALGSRDIRIPVGRVQYLYVFPLSFGEFLEAIGNASLRKHISDTSRLKDLQPQLHEKLLEFVRKYLFLGGMPAVVFAYIKKGSIKQCQEIQKLIIETYIDDFAKYSRKSRHQHLRSIIASVPSMVGKKFVYSRVDSSVKSRNLKEAFELLEMAGVIYRIKRTGETGVPLEAGVKENCFKALCLDVGLFHAISGIYSETSMTANLTDIFEGAVTEQFVGQEFLVNSSPRFKPSLYYWAREARGSSAEVDYLLQQGTEIVPVEVKSGKLGRLKSLRMFMERYKPATALKISQESYSEEKGVSSIPLYAIEALVT